MAQHIDIQFIHSKIEGQIINSSKDSGACLGEYRITLYNEDACTH
jgi:hypothetical protein